MGMFARFVPGCVLSTFWRAFAGGESPHFENVATLGRLESSIEENCDLGG